MDAEPVSKGLPMALTTKPGSKRRDLIALALAVPVVVGLFWGGSKVLDYLLIGSVCDDAREELVAAQRAIDVFGGSYDRVNYLHMQQVLVAGYCKD